jgi:hypothetical protein
MGWVDGRMDGARNLDGWIDGLQLYNCYNSDQIRTTRYSPTFSFSKQQADAEWSALSPTPAKTCLYVALNLVVLRSSANVVYREAGVALFIPGTMFSPPKDNEGLLKSDHRRGEKLSHMRQCRRRLVSDALVQEGKA